MPKRRGPAKSKRKTSAPKLHERMLRRWFNEVWNKRRVKTIHELMAPKAPVSSNAGNISGTAEFEAFFHQFHADFTEIRMTILKVFATDTMGACHWRLTAKHVPTSKPVQITGTTMVQVKNGKFIAGWQNYDEAALAAQVAR